MSWYALKSIPNTVFVSSGIACQCNTGTIMLLYTEKYAHIWRRRLTLAEEVTCLKLLRRHEGRPGGRQGAVMHLANIINKEAALRQNAFITTGSSKNNQEEER